MLRAVGTIMVIPGIISETFVLAFPIAKETQYYEFYHTLLSDVGA